MPLPQKVIEQLGREPARTPGWSGKLLMVSSTIFVLALGAYVGVEFGYKNYLNGKLAALDKQIAEATASVSTTDVDTVRAFYSQLTNIKTLLNKHVVTSRFFTWLEANTGKRVSWSDLVLRQGANEVQMNGRAATVNDYVNQVRYLEKLPEVEKVTSQSVRIDEAAGAWDFDARIVFREGFFAVTPPASNAAPAANPPSGQTSGTPNASSSQ